MSSTFDPEKWHAVVYDDDNFVFNSHMDEYLKIKLADEEDILEDTNAEPEELALVRGSAVPIPQSSMADEEFYRAPGVHRTLDRIDIEDIHGVPYSELALLWTRTKAMADAMNEAGVE